MLFEIYHLTYQLVDCLLEVSMEKLDLKHIYIAIILNNLSLNKFIMQIPLNSISNGNNTIVHFCSYDQSPTGNFLNEFAK